MENSQNTNFNGFREREKGNRPVVTIWLGITPRSVKTELFSQKNILKGLSHEIDFKNFDKSLQNLPN